ncbi:hypothetical protein PHYBOEH_003202 [Phytophthora boehmeriae]|uniref:M96 mating-specific protein family n=1 Tax=Phytophthora boehmeriae TaxID=109152 RepID=A0A8T1WPD1_9STRA|nr:hypothetical protein PHYBOEH_003202 [Phytophthora boehmeriae]
MASPPSDTTSTASSSSPPATLNPTPSLTGPAPKKKRVRRQQVELRYLRELTGKLEHRLEQLKKRRVTSNSLTSPADSAQSYQIGINGAVNYSGASLWEGIADRQFKERKRAEKQNQELKMALITQSNKARSMQERMHKALSDEQQQQELAVLQLPSKSIRSWEEDEEGVFAELLTLIVRLHLELQQRQVEDPRSILKFATWGISPGIPCVRTNSDESLVLERHGFSLLPFGMKTTVTAFWRIFSETLVKKDFDINETVYTDDEDIVARSFTCSAPHHVEMRGKQTCRKYADSDGGSTIVFAGRSSPVNVEQTPCREVEVYKSGWIKVRQVQSDDPDQQSSTVVEMHAEMMPQFRNGSKGQEMRAREVINWMNKSHQAVNEWFTQALSDVLVEEDWKTFHEAEGTVLALSK